MEWAHVNLDEVNGLQRWYGQQPRKVRIGSAMMLNKFAYGTRQAVISHLPTVMTVRAPAFVGTRVRYTKTSTGTPVNQQQTTTGSIATDRFSAWTEQEQGTPTARKRFGTLSGRGGSMQGKLRPSARLKPGNEVIGIEDYKPRGGKVSNFIAMLFRKKETRLVKIGKGYFKLPKKTSAIPGPTKSGGTLHRALELVQVGQRKQPKQLHWLEQSRTIYFRKTNLNQVWASVCNQLMTPPPKK